VKLEQVKEIANAVLYEGYLLYPYRRSAIKNRQRWTFGVVYPREYSEAQGGIDPWLMRTECLVIGGSETTLDITIRFLHLLVRRPSHAGPANAPAGPRLLAYQPDAAWQEGMEREMPLSGLRLGNLAQQPQQVAISFPGEHLEERQSQALAGSVRLAAEALMPLDDPAGVRLFKLSVQIENTTPETGAVEVRHEAIVLQSFVSTHAILQVQQGRFVSLLEPPEALQAAAQGCRNERTWPVLVGEAGETGTLLSSPIILYDYPQIAPQSLGPLFDGTEIDEILTLRILTLTDEEKEEIRQGDERARALLERTEAMTAEELMQLHGTIRNLHPLDSGGEL
jgi:hydrogenase maturation protease